MKRKKIVSYDRILKAIFKHYYSSLGLEVQTDYELNSLPRTFDILVVKAEKVEELPDSLILNTFKRYNIISYKSVSDRFKMDDFHDLIIYLAGFVKQEREASYENTTLSVISTYKPRKVFNELKIVEGFEEGIYRLDMRLFEIRFYVINELKFRDQEELFLLLPLGSSRKKREFKEEVKRKWEVEKELIDRFYEYLYIIDRELAVEIGGEKKMRGVPVEHILELPWVKEEVRRAKEEGVKKGIKEMIQRLLNRGYSLDEVADFVGMLDKREVK